MASNVQTLRLRRPPTAAEKPAPKVDHRSAALLHDQLRRAARAPWHPSFSMAVRILLLMRVAGAMYSNIQDCDEVFNFWEPLHYLDQGYGFQTWEVTPLYAIRSWAYILIHLPVVRIANLMFGSDKRPAFFAIRIFLAVTSVFCEAKLYRSVVEKVNVRVGRYFFFMLLFSAGMWNASAAFLPSSFAMYFICLAFSESLAPASFQNKKRAYFATLFFATGAIVGWPFAIAIATPFVYEELFIAGLDRVNSSGRFAWMMSRWTRLIFAGFTAALLFVPVVAFDSVAYGRWVVVPWNIVRYNIFGGSERGPDLYGTSPWDFYLLNLLLNFNVLVIMALLSLPVLYITSLVDRKRLGIIKPNPGQSSPFILLALRLAPVYVWFGILTLQAHKEERFMFPIYPMICFNAAVTLYLIRGWMETAYIKLTSSSYKASKTVIFSNMTFSVIITSGILSLSRILALWHYYHAPLYTYSYFGAVELPRLLNDTGLLPHLEPGVEEEDRPRVDYSPLEDFDLRLCLGKEWHRFPGHYLVQDVVKVNFIKSSFDGSLPVHFESHGDVNDLYSWWDRKGTRVTPLGTNDLNRENQRAYVPVETCDYLVDLDFPLHPSESVHEPRYAVDEDWERVLCSPFLDSRNSPLLSRTLWMPGDSWRNLNEYGDYCLLKNKALLGTKEQVFSERHRS